MAVPKTDWNLFVPSAASGGIPLHNKAGITSSPPPLAIESMNPATSATAVKAARSPGSTIALV